MEKISTEERPKKLVLSRETIKRLTVDPREHYGYAHRLDTCGATADDTCGNCEAGCTRVPTRQPPTC